MFTSGPWKVWQSMTDNSINVSAVADRAFVCQVGKLGEDLQPNDDNIRADARLIAAAPELLQQLRNLVGLAEVRGGLDEYKSALADAKAVIAKADGQSATHS